MPLSSVLLLACSCTQATDAATAVDDCNLPASHRWEHRPPPAMDAAAKIEPVRVVKIVTGVSDAVQALSLQSAVPITDAAFASYTGARVPKKDQRSRPYLVRAVYPGDSASVSVGRSGNVLFVSAYALGCAPFTGHPVIVFLPSPPREVFVEASAAL